MYAAFSRTDPEIDDVSASDRRAPAPSVHITAPQDGASAYHGGSRRPVLVAVLVAHALLLFALVKLDVLHIQRTPPPPLVIEMIAPDQPPPSVVIPRPLSKAPPPDAPIVAPPPIAEVPVQASPIAAAPIVTPPTLAAPRPTVVAPAPAPPVTPPDASAATLGNAPPRYPAESRRRHEEGVVRLRVLISTAGSVLDIGVARTSGFERLDQAALEAVRRWRFRPGMQAGQPVEAVGFLPIPFVLTR